MKPMDRAYLKARVYEIPFSVHFDLTFRCNQRCVHCYLPEEWLRGQGPGRELDTGQVKSVLDQLAAAGTFLLTFSGGEIFLRPDLMNLIEYARRLNFSLALKTNGTLGPNDEQLETLAAMGLDSVQLSLYSVDPALHDRVTGSPGSWARMMRTMEKCRARGLRVALFSTIFNLTFNQIHAIYKFAMKEDIYLRMTGFLDPRWDGQPFPAGLELSPEQNREIQSLMGTELRHWKDELMAPLSPELSGDYEGCEAGKTICYLTPQGDLWPCMGLPCNCGRVIEPDGFAKVWQASQKLNACRAMPGRLGETEDPCEYFMRTMQGTIMEHYFLT